MIFFCFRPDFRHVYDFHKAHLPLYIYYNTRFPLREFVGVEGYPAVYFAKIFAPKYYIVACSLRFAQTYLPSGKRDKRYGKCHYLVGLFIFTVNFNIFIDTTD